VRPLSVEGHLDDREQPQEKDIMAGRLARLFGAAGVLTAALVPIQPAGAETQLERGRYLVNGIVACGNCHTPRTPEGPRAGMELAGGTPFVEGDLFAAYAPNITPDKETGIGNWTDVQIIRAIRGGVRPDGSVIGPPMPIELYRGMSYNDAAAIVAYLRTVPPVKNIVPKSVYNIPLRKTYDSPVGSGADTSPADPVAKGAYLASTLGHCIECHTPMKGAQRDFEHRLGAGGFELSGPWGVAITANITPDKETGIGAWSDAEIIKAITEGLRPDGSRLGPPMAFAYYRNIRAEDLKALVAYLRSLKPIKNAVK
jgi:mono/diheme cytochrome c family protein